MNRFAFASGLVACVVALAFSAPARADLIVNGGFETPAIGSSFVTYGAGDSSLAPWVITSGSVDLVGSFWPAYEGDQSLDLSGNEAGTIQQLFATTPGQTYTLTFAYANHPNVAEASATVSVLGAGTLLSQDIIHTGSTYSNMMYTIFVADFLSDSSMTTLVFADTTPTPSLGIVLDAVSVTPSVVPEPSSLALACIGLLAGLSSRWRSCRAA